MPGDDKCRAPTTENHQEHICPNMKHEKTLGSFIQNSTLIVAQWSYKASNWWPVAAQRVNGMAELWTLSGVWICQSNCVKCKGSHIVLQIVSSLQAGVSQLIGSYLELRRQPVTHQNPNTMRVTRITTCHFKSGSGLLAVWLTSSSVSSMLWEWLLWSSGLLATSSSSIIRLRVSSCVTNGCWRNKFVTICDSKDQQRHCWW